MRKIFFNLYIISVLFLIFVTNINSIPVVRYIKNDNNLIKQMRFYDIHQDSCKDILPRLVLISDIEYYGFDDKIHTDGKIIVLDAVADNIIKIFQELKKVKYPIGGIDPFLGLSVKKFLWFKSVKKDDDYNFIYSYNCRRIINGEKISIHAYALAIDVNPLHNPFIGIDINKKEIINVIPKDGIFHINRIKDRPRKPYGYGLNDERIVSILKKNGFEIWGGYWDYPVDNNHFQTSRDMAELLISLESKDAKILFQKHVEYINRYNKSLVDDEKVKNVDLVKLYTENRDKFFILINSCLKTNK